MKRTQATLKEMGEILTENDEVKKIMEILAQKAGEKGLPIDEWENIKTGIMANCFYMIAEKDERIRNDLAMDVYEALRS